MITNSTSRFALTQIFLDRTRMDEVTTTYMVKAPSDYGVQRLSSVFTSSACSGYRYGFNGMEKDDEVKGAGNSYDFGARMYDARLGRFLRFDNNIKEHTSESPYSAIRNSTIHYVDHDGKEWINTHTEKVRQLEQQILDNPNDKKIQSALKNEREKEVKVAEYLKKIQDNDVSLYNYVDLLQVENSNGDKVNVKVNVSVTDYDANQKDVGKTMYTNQGDFIKYKDLEGNEGYFAPINKDGEIGFDVTLNGKFSFNDETLA